MLQEKQERINQVVEDMLCCQEAIGKELPEAFQTYGFVPGMGMETEAENITAYVQTLKDGIFPVLFTGVFSAGKSTLINALVGKKLLEVGIRPETAVITQLVFGKEEKVTVYKKQSNAVTGEQVTENYSIQEFKKKYKIDEDNPELFEDVDYVILNQPGDGIAGTAVQLVDSPGTNHTPQDTQAALKFADTKASAVIYLMNATSAFNEIESDYIKDNYVGKEKKNVFFVINWINMLPDVERDKLKKAMRKNLEAVFTYNGKFDEKMFQDRVFYVDARTSLYARLGEPMEIQPGFEVPMDISKDATTGVPEFEAALEHFLKDDDRDVIAIQANIPKLARVYVNAEKKMKQQMERYGMDVDALIQQREEVEQSVRQTEMILDRITDTCHYEAVTAMNRIKEAYDNFVARFNSGWDEYFSQERLTQIDFGMMNVIRLATTSDEEKKEKIIKPIVDVISEYLTIVSTSLENEVKDIIGNCVSNLEEKLATCQRQLEEIHSSIDFTEIMESINGLLSIPNPGGGGDSLVTQKMNVLQIIMGIMFLDPESIIKGTLGEDDNKTAILDSLAINIMDAITLSIGAPVFWIIKVVSTLNAWVTGGSQSTEIFIGKLKEVILRALPEGKIKLSRNMETGLQGSIIRAGNAFAENFREKLEDYQKTLEKTIEDLNDKNFDIDFEKERMSRILSLLETKISHINELTGGEKLNAELIRAKAEGSAAE